MQDHRNELLGQIDEGGSGQMSETEPADDEYDQLARDSTLTGEEKRPKSEVLKEY
jgi:hypothetical protein